MPNMDGCETTQRIRNNADNQNQNTTIIALTAAALLDEKNRALEAGMDDHLSKPLRRQTLADALIKFTSQGSNQ